MSCFTTLRILEKLRKPLQASQKLQTLWLLAITTKNSLLVSSKSSSLFLPQSLIVHVMFHNSEDSGNIQNSFKGQILDTLVFLLSFSMFECQMGFIVLVIFQFKTPESSKESGKPPENVWK